jgi:uncharacterized protein (DUF427 family)
MEVMHSHPPRRVQPRPGQESVWDYPRPPVCVSSDRHVLVRLGDTVVAETREAYRVLETSHPPTWYLPPDSVVAGSITRSAMHSTWCEWKGAATYWDVLGLPGAAWSYETPSPGFEVIAGYLTFYPSRLACAVDGEPVQPQDGGFYGGWITSDVVGPFKGGPGTVGW